MPLYNYECKSCGDKFTKKFKVDDRKIPEQEMCSECGAVGRVQQVIEESPAFNYDNRMGAHRMTDSFNDRLKEIKKDKGRTSTIQTK